MRASNVAETVDLGHSRRQHRITLPHRSATEHCKPKRPPAYRRPGTTNMNLMCSELSFSSSELAFQPSFTHLYRTSNDECSICNRA